MKILFLSALSIATLCLVSPSANALDTKDDPFGFGTLKNAMDEAKRTGTISPETKKELEAIQQRGKEAQAVLDREKVGQSELNEAKMLSARRDYKAADPLYRKSLAAREKAYGGYDPLLMDPLNGLAECYAEQGWKNEAAQLYTRTIAIGEPAVQRAKRGSVMENAQANVFDCSLAIAMSRLGRIYEKLGKLSAAEAVYKKAQLYSQKYPTFRSFGSDWQYAELLRKMHRDGEAMEIEAKMRAKK